MTIVDLSDLDTFIRDSLFEVRRGIANSRNATQANPLLGVMVDLPEKIDFEVMVTSAHQGLTRNIVSSDSDNSSEATTGSQNSSNTSKEAGATTGQTSGSRASQGTDVSVEAQTGTSSATNSESGTRSDNETRSTTAGGTDSSTETDEKTQQSVQKQGDIKKGFSKQLEQHAEANDRGSMTFDEEEGSWGGKGQYNTPLLSIIPCTCT